jgi:hypothetical protein
MNGRTVYTRPRRKRKSTATLASKVHRKWTGDKISIGVHPLQNTPDFQILWVPPGPEVDQ